MRFFILSLFGLLLSQNFFAQDYKGAFAIIEDADGYTNVRDRNKKIINKIYKNEVFAVSLFDDLEGAYLYVEHG